MLRTMMGCLALGLLWHATAGIAPAGEKEGSGRAMVVKLIADSDPEFRAAALDQVRSAFAGEAATKEFAALLEQLKEPAQQVGLLSALADRGDKAARPAVLKLLAASGDESVRGAALGALAALGSANELPLIITALSAQSAVERAAAKLALTQMRGDAVTSALAADLKSASPVVKAALIEVLATRRASDEIPTFLTAALDDNAQVRTAAVKALGQIGRPEQIGPMLVAVLKAPKGGERDEAEKNVALICARIDNEDRRGDALIKALDTVSPAERDQLLSLVGRVGGKKLIKFVADIATGSDTARRKLGVDALTKWPDASPADTLLEIARKAGSPADRATAFQGYVKVASMRDKRNDKQRLDRMKQAIKEAQTDEEKTLVIRLARTSYDVDTLRFVLPYVDESPFAQIACETIVELAHHREVRDPNKAEFDKALDKVIAATSNPEVVERANRYKRGETWDRATKGK
ncbi:MAG: HEAT repeat domain-containing protein [Planctomycetes bacterium]|nr:HEAT repeat domain-containing protein [Planctomycetota bacterium]